MILVGDGISELEISEQRIGFRRPINFVHRCCTRKCCPPLIFDITTMVFPHIYISCPCSDISTPVSDSYNSSDRDKGQGGEDEEEEVEEHEQATFNPRSRRANFSLYLLEHLLFCEDCHQIKCPRCTIEEIACWYCSSCLFEFPSTMVKSDGTRWVRTQGSSLLSAQARHSFMLSYLQVYEKLLQLSGVHLSHDN